MGVAGGDIFLTLSMSYASLAMLISPYFLPPPNLVFGFNNTGSSVVNQSLNEGKSLGLPEVFFILTTEVSDVVFLGTDTLEGVVLGTDTLEGVVLEEEVLEVNFLSSRPLKAALCLALILSIPDPTPLLNLAPSTDSNDFFIGFLFLDLPALSNAIATACF